MLRLLLVALIATALGPAPSHALEILDQSLDFGQTSRLILHASESFAGNSIEIPVSVIRGSEDGPVLCLTAAIHGDELNGVEIARRVVDEMDPEYLRGTVIAVPIVNLHGFRRGSRYLPDRRDLNRYFPGNGGGSSASRIAATLFESVIRRCDALVDLHTGSFHRTNLPQIRADLRMPSVRGLAMGITSMSVVHSEGLPGTLRRSAVDAGIPAICYEAGESNRFHEEEIRRGVASIREVLRHMDMLPQLAGPPRVRAVFHRSHWVRVDEGGILLARVALGDAVGKGDVLGTVTDPISGERVRVRSPWTGRVLGMALNQVVIPGFAAFRIGEETGAGELGEVIALLDGPGAADSADWDDPH